MAWVFERRETAARDRRTIDGKHPDPGLAEIGRQDERVMAGAEDDAVVAAHVPEAHSVLAVDVLQQSDAASDAFHGQNRTACGDADLGADNVRRHHQIWRIEPGELEPAPRWIPWTGDEDMYVPG